MSIVKKYNVGKHRLSIVVGNAYTEWLRPLEELKNIRNLHESCGNMFSHLKHSKNFNVTLDKSFHQEVKDCLLQAFALSDTLDEFLQNGLLNHFNYTIKIDLTMAFKPVEISVIDGKFSGQYDPSFGYQTVALSSFDRNTGAGESHFLFSPNEFLRDPFITLEEASGLSAIHAAAMKDDLYSSSKAYKKMETLEGFLIPNTDEMRKKIKLLITRVQNRWSKMDQEARIKELHLYGEAIKMTTVTKRYLKTMTINNTKTVLLGVYPLLSMLVNTGMVEESRLGLKVTQDQTNYILAIV